MVTVVRNQLCVAGVLYDMRVAVIAKHILPFVLSFLRDRRRWIVAGRPVPRTEEFHRQRAEGLVAAIGTLGPTFVKLAQVFAGRADLFPEPYVRALSTLTDQVPAVPLEAVERTILESYGRSPETLFERFEPVPIAAASLGQVHRAVFEGREVVVKVLRPNIEHLVASDVRAAQWILKQLERRFATNPHVRGLRVAVEEFALRIGDEMDFRKEAANAERIRANFVGNRRVMIPRIEQELVRQRVLVMEYMEGVRIDRVDGRGSGLDGRRGRSSDIVATVMELYIQMMLVDGLFHADPHPGNLLVSPDGRIILLDFGMVVPVPRETRWHLIQTVFASIRKDVDGVVAGFEALGVIEPGADPAMVRELVGTLLELAHSRTTVPERIEMLLADQVMGTLYDWPVQLPREMVYFGRAAALIEGLGVHYDPRFNPIVFAAPIALKMRRRILASLGDAPQRDPNEWVYTLSGVLGAVAGVFTRAGKSFFSQLEREFEAARPADIPRIEPKRLPAAASQ
jgi:predicted unusual protein kinase regulating ubiquinone biosynthesis (AarF/ABC1/UbiB family)